MYVGLELNLAIPSWWYQVELMVGLANPSSGVNSSATYYRSVSSATTSTNNSSSISSSSLTSSSSTLFSSSTLSSAISSSNSTLSATGSTGVGGYIASALGISWDLSTSSVASGSLASAPTNSWNSFTYVPGFSTAGSDGTGYSTDQTSTTSSLNSTSTPGFTGSTSLESNSTTPANGLLSLATGLSISRTSSSNGTGFSSTVTAPGTAASRQGYNSTRIIHSAFGSTGLPYATGASLQPSASANSTNATRTGNYSVTYSGDCWAQWNEYWTASASAGKLVSQSLSSESEIFQVSDFTGAATETVTWTSTETVMDGSFPVDTQTTSGVSTYYSTSGSTSFSMLSFNVTVTSTDSARAALITQPPCTLSSSVAQCQVCFFCQLAESFGLLTAANRVNGTHGCPSATLASVS
jgi:trimeric autotransporter adhesin